MIKIYIQSPVWHSRAVGVDNKKIKDDLLIEILYKNASGEREYPGIYYVPKVKALDYPIQKIDGGVKLHLIPIDDLQRLTKEQEEYIEYCKFQGIEFKLI